MTGSVIALAVQLGVERAQAQAPPPILDAVRVEVTAVADSSAYLLYEYRIVNPASSHGGVAVVDLDLSAPAGTGHVVLPFTGSLYPRRRDIPDHVPFGAIVPERWQMLVDWKARLMWSAYAVILTEGPPGSFDSVAPGAAKNGFGVRSPYLPGVRAFIAMPTEQSCCTKPNARGEYPNSALFFVGGFTVAPKYAPKEMTPLVLSDLLGRACELGWITRGGGCEALRAKLAPAREAHQRGDHGGATLSLRAFVAELDAQHGPGKPMNDNAYWLLKVNGAYLLAHM
jgi:hypothetical protein